MATATKPDLLVDIDFDSNPTAGYFDQRRYADGLVSYWRLNSGATLVDELGANTGTMNGSPPTVAGAFAFDADLAVSFDGSTDDGVVGSAAAVANPFTLEGWVKVAALPASTRDLVAKRGSYLLQMNSAGKLLFLVKNDTTVTTVQSGAGVVTGAWYHVACTYDGATARIYVNGVLDQSAAHTVGLGLGLQPLRFAATPSTASPTYQSSQLAVSAVGSTSVTANVPLSTATGDLLLAHINLANGTSVITPPAGWTLLSNVAHGTSDLQAVYYKIAGASEPASYTFTLSVSARWCIAISRFTGVDSSFPIADIYVASTVSGTSHSTGSHLASVDNTLIVAMFGGTGTTWTESSGTEQYDQQSGAGGTHVSQAMCQQAQASAASLAVTGTSGIATLGYATFIALCGSGLNRVACTLDDFSLWNIAQTADDVVRGYESRLGGGSSWLAVTSDVKQMSFKIGRQYELNRIEKGDGDAVLNDLKRTYDPSNTSSSRYPNVIPMRQIRGRLSTGAATFPVGGALVSKWVPRWASPNHAEVALTLEDGFELLSLAPVDGTLANALAGAQINVLLDKATWSRSKRAIDTGHFAMAQTVLSTSALALTEIQTIADSELGIFFIDLAGVATFHDFSHRWTSSRSINSQATFADDGTFIAYRELDPPIDKDNTINEWIVSTAGGFSASARDGVSSARFGPRSRTRTTRLDDPLDAQVQATWLLQQAARPSQRFNSLTVQPGTNATAWATVLGLTISDRVTVIRNPLPVAGGSRIRKDCFIEGINWRFPTPAQTTWTVTFDLSPCSFSSYYDALLRYGPVSYWRMNTVA